MGMQLRSRRRLLSPRLLPQGGVRRWRFPRGDGDGEDRISGLPQELRLEVLRRVCLHDAVRTSFLSRYWRFVWTGLRHLTFDDVDPDAVEGALGQVRSKQLDRLEIIGPVKGHAIARVSSLLRAADRLDPAELVVERLADMGDFELPCFRRATSVELDIDALTFTLPPSGNFASLEKLHLKSVTVDLHALLPRCPLLRKLWVDYWHLPGNATTHSNSLEELAMGSYRSGIDGHDWPVLNIVAPELKKLMWRTWWWRSSMFGKFPMLLSAPKLEEISVEHDEVCSWSLVES